MMTAYMYASNIGNEIIEPITPLPSLVVSSISEDGIETFIPTVYSKGMSLPEMYSGRQFFMPGLESEIDAYLEKQAALALAAVPPMPDDLGPLMVKIGKGQYSTQAKQASISNSS